MVDDGAHLLLKFVGRVLFETVLWAWEALPVIGRFLVNGLFRVKRRLHPFFEGLIGLSVVALIAVEVGFYVAPYMT